MAGSKTRRVVQRFPRLDQLTDRLLKLGVVRKEDFRPCTPADISRLERKHEVVFPAAYRAFLRRMGRGAGEFLRSAHWAAFYRDLLSLNNTVREHLDDVPLPEKRFCFATCLGEVYLFFDANGRDDPTIWYWNERIDPGVRKAYDSLWDWLEEMVEDYERCWRPRKVERRRVPSAR